MHSFFHSHTGTPYSLSTRRLGFTLVEIMIVIAIIGILFSMGTYMFSHENSTTNADRITEEVHNALKMAREGSMFGRGVNVGTGTILVKSRTVYISPVQITTYYTRADNSGTGIEVQKAFPFFDKNDKYRIADISVLSARQSSLSAATYTGHSGSIFTYSGLTNISITFERDGLITFSTTDPVTFTSENARVIQIASSYLESARTVQLDRVTGVIDELPPYKVDIASIPTLSFAYSWSQGGYGICVSSNGCGAGNQTQVVECHKQYGADVIVAPDADCISGGAGAKPAASQACTLPQTCTYPFSCNGLPTHASWNTATGYTQTWDKNAGGGSGGYMPLDTVPQYNVPLSVSYCGYACDAGYTYSGTIHACINAINYCTAGGTIDCVVAPTVGVDCTSPWGMPVTNGTSVTAYQTSTVPYGSTCVSENRVCTASTLAGSYTNSSCTVLGPPYCIIGTNNIDACMIQ